MSALDETSRMTIVPGDRTMYLDQGSYSELDFSNISIPAYVCVLHWKPSLGFGWIEHHEPEDPFTQTKPDNERITELPQWALQCYAVWEQAHIASTQQ